MLNTIAQRLNFSPKVLNIVIVQYERNDYGVGTEEELHWALILLERGHSVSRGDCFQAVDRRYNGQDVQWTLFDKQVDLRNTRKCLGGVCIGQIKESDVPNLRGIITSNPPIPKSAQWNCRDWIMEIIHLLTEKGWVTYQIPDQATLVTTMRVSSVATMEVYNSNGRMPVVLPLGYVAPGSE